MTLPDFLPFLRHGVGDTPQDGGCLVQVAGFLYDGKSWSDSVTCVHPVLREAGIRVNDSVDDESRRRLALSAARIAGSNDAVEGWSEQDKKVLNVRLAVWAARQVLHLVRNKDRALTEQAIGAAEAWADDPSDQKAYAAAAAAYTAAADAACAAANAACAADADAAAYATHAYAAAAANAACAEVDLYEGLIDEFDRLTGRTSEPLTREQGETIRNLSGAMAR